jgi:hypothetical protein
VQNISLVKTAKLDSWADVADWGRVRAEGSHNSDSFEGLYATGMAHGVGIITNITAFNSETGTSIDIINTSAANICLNLYLRDYNINTGVKFTITGDSYDGKPPKVGLAIQFQLPSITDAYGEALFSFDSVHFGVLIRDKQTKVENDGKGVGMIICGKNFFSKGTTLVDTVMHNMDAGKTALYDDILSTYYTNGSLLDDDNFYVSKTWNEFSEYQNGTKVDNNLIYSGYQNFTLPNITDISSYNKLKWIMMLNKTCVQTYHELTFYSLAVIFKKSISIKDTLFTGLKGRTFNATWDGRKNTDDMIKTPLEILEHFKRLDSTNTAYKSINNIKLTNLYESFDGKPVLSSKSIDAKNYANLSFLFNALGATAAMQFKLTSSDNSAYDTADGALQTAKGIRTLEIGDVFRVIDTGTPTVLYMGNTNTLYDINLCRPAFQVVEKDKATKQVLVKDLCETFFLVNYQNKNGYECVKPLLGRELENNDKLPLITLAHVIGDIENVEEPDTNNIYCEPFLNYAFNYARDKYDKQLAITNVEKNEYKPSYAIGFNTTITRKFFIKNSSTGILLTDGEYLWNLYHDIYSKYGVINKPPSNVTDKYMIRTYTDAVWFLYNMSKVMQLKRIGFSVPYLITGDNDYDYEQQPRDWELMEHLRINFPRQTNGKTVEVAIESITKDKNNSKVTVKCIILDELKTTAE